MKVVCCYNYPVRSCGPEHEGLAQRFIDSYQKYPPLHEHEMIVVSNGGPPAGRAVAQFSWIKGTKFIQRENHGMDIGAYQLAARSWPCDMMVFFGGSSYLRGPGWLKRMVDAYTTLGDALYGCTGNQGNSNGVWPHVRTTGFWCNPALINEHPFRVTDNSMRYGYEHGPAGLTSWVLNSGKAAWIVGWDDVKPIYECDSMIEGYHKGNQTNVLVGDRRTSPPFHHCT